MLITVPEGLRLGSLLQGLVGTLSTMAGRCQCGRARCLRAADPGARNPPHRGEMGRELGERREGRLEFRGPSATSGYFQNAVKTRELFHDGWLDTGDRGYTAGGDLFITGRI
jgi:long-subunit acyl-CoA synthetase (AMP-forming)